MDAASGPAIHRAVPLRQRTHLMCFEELWFAPKASRCILSFVFLVLRFASCLPAGRAVLIFLLRHCLSQSSSGAWPCSSSSRYRFLLLAPAVALFVDAPFPLPGALPFLDLPSRVFFPSSDEASPPFFASRQAVLISLSWNLQNAKCLRRSTAFLLVFQYSR